jgi:hypothetical protein
MNTYRVFIYELFRRAITSNELDWSDRRIPISSKPVGRQVCA